MFILLITLFIKFDNFFLWWTFKISFSSWVENCFVFYISARVKWQPICIIECIKWPAICIIECIKTRIRRAISAEVTWLTTTVTNTSITSGVCSLGTVSMRSWFWRILWIRLASILTLCKWIMGSTFVTPVSRGPAITNFSNVTQLMLVLFFNVHA